MEPIFFPTQIEFRAWLEEHHETEQELWVGFYKKGSGTPSITWPQAVDEALCFGWIDGIRKSIDDVSYKIRFTPRKSRSTWSAVNIGRMAELTSLGLVHPAGYRAFEQRVDEKSSIYAYEQRKAPALDEELEQQFRANERAWTFFQAQNASYRKASIWWVISAKKEETRAKRFARLVEDSEQGRTIPPLTRSPRVL
ncbi:MAG: YdeI/OmpD-associated family protein [Chloroflexota bacterium]|nr:YdeI/OmpD-associated family protein [Chloroflexota bacterium]